MATNYPTSIDTFVNPTSNDSLNAPSHSQQHTNLNDAMVAVQTKLGAGNANKVGMYLVNSTPFTNIVTILVDNVFTSTYDSYRINLVVTSGSGSAAEIQMKFRTAGSANGTTNYYYAGDARTYANASDLVGNNNAGYAFAFRTQGGEWNGTMDVVNPQLASKTWFTGQYADTYEAGFRGGFFNGTTQFDGIQFVNSGATGMSGLIQVYGYRNS